MEKNSTPSKRTTHHKIVSPNKILCENKFRITKLLKVLSEKYQVDTSDIAFALSETLLIMSERNE